MRAVQSPGAIALSSAVLLLAFSCRESPERASGTVQLTWYVFDEPSGAFEASADRCSGERFAIEISPLPADANQQREQLARRLAAGDETIDVIGMDVIWTAEFAEAGWIREFEGARARDVTEGRLPVSVTSATYEETLWAAPFTTNAQLLWYRTDRIAEPPRTWTELLERAEELGDVGVIEAQGQRYEGLTVFFTSLLASAGGSILDDTARSVSLEPEPTREALEIMTRFASSDSAPPALATSQEDDARLGFETGRSSFMINWPYVYASAKTNAPEVFEHMGWARWPSVGSGRPSRVTVGGLNLGVGAFSRHPELSFEAVRCLVSRESQKRAATEGGLPPTLTALYDDPDIRERFPFAGTLLETLVDAVHRPQTPLYADVSLAISHGLHPMRRIEPERDETILRQMVSRALRSEGLW